MKYMSVFSWKTLIIALLILGNVAFLNGCQSSPTESIFKSTDSPLLSAAASTSTPATEITSVAMDASHDYRVTPAEEMVRILVTKWLEGYKYSEGIDAIQDFTIEKITIMPVTQNDRAYCVIAKTSFLVIPQDYSMWASMEISSVIYNDRSWAREYMTFGVICDPQNNIYLQLLPGWGT